MQYPVVIVDYNPEWPVIFAREKEALHQLLGDIVMAIEHVGSTAVPGLAAKPIVDIMIGVEDLVTARQRCITPLEQAGYHYVSAFEKEIPERCFLYRGSSEGHSHHLHITEMTTVFWIDHILFRDYLRKYPEIAKQYGDLKRELAQKYRHQRVAYGKAKSNFIENVLAKARQEFQPDEAEE